MTRPSRRRWLVGAGLGLVLSAAACAPGSESGSSTESDASEVATDVAQLGELTLTVWDQEVRGGQNRQIEALNAAFEEQYPNVTIERVSRSFDDLRRTLRLAITAADAPDVVQANNGRSDMGAFVTAGLLRSLDGYAQAYGWTERFPESVRALASYSEDGATFGEGILYGIAQVGEIVGVWYNKAKLDQLGIAPPETFDELDAALAAAQDAGELPIQFGNLDQWPGIHEFGFVQNGYVPAEQIRTLGFGRAGADWTSADNQQAAETLTGWVGDGYFPEGFNGLGYDKAWQQFAEGEGVFLVSGTWLLADLDQALGDDLGFMLPPVGETGELAVTGGTGLPFAITEATDEPDAAAAYIDFISSPEAMQGISEAGGLPVIEAGAQDVRGAQAEVFAAWDTATSQDALVPYLDYATPTFYDTLTVQVQDLMGGEQSPDDFLATLQEDYADFAGGS